MRRNLAEELARETVRADQLAKLLLEQTALVTRARKQRDLLMAALHTIENSAREAMRQVPEEGSKDASREWME